MGSTRCTNLAQRSNVRLPERSFACVHYWTKAPTGQRSQLSLQSCEAPKLQSCEAPKLQSCEAPKLRSSEAPTPRLLLKRKNKSSCRLPAGINQMEWENWLERPYLLCQIQTTFPGGGSCFVHTLGSSINLADVHAISAARARPVSFTGLCLACFRSLIRLRAVRHRQLLSRRRYVGHNG
jgi:hypothetical protein